MREKLDLDSGLDNTLASFAMMFPKMRQKLFTLKDTPITLKQFSDWRKQRILPPDLMKYEKGKRIPQIEINFFELIWINMLTDMRSMGLSFQTLRVTKEAFWLPISPMITPMMDVYNQSPEILNALVQGMDDADLFTGKEAMKEIKELTEKGILQNMFLEGQYYSIEMYILIMLMTNAEFRVAYRYDGKILVYGHLPEINHPIFIEAKKGNESFGKDMAPFLHFSISLGYYTSQFMSAEKAEKFLYPLGLLDENENELIEVIKRGNLKELIIKFNGKSGKMESYEMKKDKDLTEEESKRIKEILLLKDYENISFKSKNNKTVYFEKSIKKMFNTATDGLRAKVEKEDVLEEPDTFGILDDFENNKE